MNNPQKFSGYPIRQEDPYLIQHKTPKLTPEQPQVVPLVGGGSCVQGPTFPAAEQDVQSFTTEFVKVAHCQLLKCLSSNALPLCLPLERKPSFSIIHCISWMPHLNTPTVAEMTRAL